MRLKGNASVGMVIAAVFGLLTLVALFSVLAGTIIWFLWPYAVPAAFPGLVASGAVAGELSWIKAVALSYLAGSLFGRVQYSKSKD